MIYLLSVTYTLNILLFKYVLFKDTGCPPKKLSYDYLEFFELNFSFNSLIISSGGSITYPGYLRSSYIFSKSRSRLPSFYISLIIEIIIILN